MRPLEPLVLVLGVFVGSAVAANGISRDDLATARYVAQLPISGSHQTWHGTWLRIDKITVVFQNNDGTRLDFRLRSGARGPISVDIGTHAG